jgi:protein-S-isoprenylcysteine O-methyltransferase Ste14
MTATSASWKHLPPPSASAREDLAFEGVFTDAELEKIVQGHVPGAMEDKWFVYFEDGWLRIHRSWTGAFIYALRFEKTTTGARVVESWVNRDPEQYPVLNTEYDRRHVRYMINRLLLLNGDGAQRVYVPHKPRMLGRAFRIVRELIRAARALAVSVAFIGLWVWIAAYVRRFDPRIPLTLPGWLVPVGLPLAIAGELVLAACIITFQTAGWGTPVPFAPPRRLVVVGPYRYVRNPMYLGAAALILGGGLAIASPAVVLLTVGFLFLMHLVVLYEEDTLTLRFYDDYPRYKAAVHRWWVRRPPKGEAPARITGAES